MSQEKLLETLRQGLRDELSAAVNYTRLSAKIKNTALKKAFLNYAIDEMKHAQNLTALLEAMGASGDEILLAENIDDDLYIHLVNYIACEEAAIFYYDILEKLFVNEEIKLTLKQIQTEEERHLTNISEIFNKLKSGEYING